MATFIIPTEKGSNQGHYSLEVDLDGVTFIIELRYNSRQESWFMTIKDSAGNILRSGVAVVASFPLLRRMKDQSKPSGYLMAVPVSDDSIPAPGLDELGKEVLLTYTGDS